MAVAPTTTTTAIEAAPTTAAVTFASCKAAADAGFKNMHEGQPGYSARLDRDGDGVACDG